MIHPTADISPTATIGAGTRVWHHTQIGDRAQVGAECIVGSNVYIDREVIIGNRVKIQTGAQLYHGSVVEDGVFIGPSVCLTNDKYPRAITPEGWLKTDADWEAGAIRICYGASLGAGVIVLPNVVIGRFAMVAAGTVVVRDVPDYGLVVGAPARLIGYVCVCGRRLVRAHAAGELAWECPVCHLAYPRLPAVASHPTAEIARSVLSAPDRAAI